MYFLFLFLFFVTGFQRISKLSKERQKVIYASKKAREIWIVNIWKLLLKLICLSCFPTTCTVFLYQKKTCTVFEYVANGFFVKKKYVANDFFLAHGSANDYRIVPCLNNLLNILWRLRISSSSFFCLNKFLFLNN